MTTGQPRPAEAHSVNAAMRFSTLSYVLVISIAVFAIAACGEPGALPAAQPSEPSTVPDLEELVRSTEALREQTDTTSSMPGEVEAVFRAPEATGGWTDVTSNLVGLDSTCGNVSFVSARPGASTVLTGISSHGLWELSDDAMTWTKVGRDAEIDHRLAWVEYDPDTSDRYWISGSYGRFAAFRTDDGGRTFAQLGDATHADRISVDLTDPNRATMLLGKHEQRVVLLSQDGGKTWSDIAITLPDDAGFTSYPQVITAQVFLIGSYNGEASGIYRTEDAGATWTQVFEGGAIGAPIVAGETIIWATKGGELAVSEDGGRTFERSNASSGGRTTSLLELPDGALATVGGSSIVVTTDQGDTWESVGPEFPFRPFGLAFSAGRSAFYAWTFTCNFGDGADPVLENSIVELPVTFPTDR